MAKAKNKKEEKKDIKKLDKKSKSEEELLNEILEEPTKVRTYQEDDEEDVVEIKEENETAHLLNQIKTLAWVMLVILVINTLILGIALNKDTSSEDKTNETPTEETNTEYDVSMFNEVNADEIEKLYKDDRTSVIYMGRPSCGFCVQFLPSLQKSVEEYDYTLHYFNTESPSEEEVEKIRDLDSFFEENYGETPAVVIVRDGKVIAEQIGASDYETLQKLLEDNGIEKK